MSAFELKTYFIKVITYPVLIIRGYFEQVQSTCVEWALLGCF